MITHLVDSDRLIDYLKGVTTARQTLDGLMDEAVLATSAIVAGEVREGALGHDMAVRDLDTLLTVIDVLDVDHEISVVYAQLRKKLRSTGELLSDNDLWIASTALRHDLTLISRDKAFDRVPNLKLMR